MDKPIHAANNVDSGETMPRIIAAIAGVVILAVVAGVVAYSGMWNPPPTTKAHVQHTQSASL